MSDYCKFIPGDGQTKSLIVPGKNYSGDNFYRDSPNFDDVDALITQYRNTAVIDLAGGIDKEQLQQITKDLNLFVKEETARIDRDIDKILGGKVKPSKNDSGFSTTYDDLWKQQLVYDAKNPYPAVGLQVPTSGDRSHWGGKYPFLYDRLRDNPNISGAECDKFLRDYNFDRNNFSKSLRNGLLDPNGTDMLGLLNDFYSLGAFSSTAIGMFCSMVPDIFATVNQLVNAFNSGREMVQDVLSFLANPAAIDWKLSEAAVKTMLDQLKNHVLNFVDQLAKTAMQKVYNITGGWIDPQYIYNHGALSEKFVREKEKAASFFSKENLQGIKDKIQGAIQYAAGVFERMDLEEIQFLIMRFCELLQSIEQLFFGMTTTMSNMIQNYQAVHSLLSGSGDLATAEALAAGAVRYDSGSRMEGIRFAGSLPSYGPVDSSPMAAPGSQIPSDGRGVPANVAPMTQDEIGSVPSYEQIKDGGSQFLAFQGGGLTMGPAGWTNARAEEKVMLIRLAKELGGRRLTVNCAYRSPEHNKKVGGATNSVHMSGKAFDISHSGMGTSVETFINTARSVGFRGFGYYNTFNHIDTGNPRTWGNR